jgi:hypothetical protein
MFSSLLHYYCCQCASPSEYKNGDKRESFHKKQGHGSDLFPSCDMNFLGEFNAKICREDVFENNRERRFA